MASGPAGSCRRSASTCAASGRCPSRLRRAIQARPAATWRIFFTVVTDFEVTLTAPGLPYLAADHASIDHGCIRVAPGRCDDRVLAQRSYQFDIAEHGGTFTTPLGAA